MYCDIRWEDECLEDLANIFGSLEDADDATNAVTWELARDPISYTWELAPGSPIRLTWVKPHREFPAIFLSFLFIDELGERHCLMKRARRANAPGAS